MKCQHCGSDDIVIIQGQNYCLNCGHAVVAPAAPAPAMKPDPVNQSVPDVATVVQTSEKKTAAKKDHDKKRKKVQSETTAPPKAGASDITHRRRPAPAIKALHPLRFSLTVSLILGLLVGCLVTAAIWFKLDTDLVLYLSAAAIVTCSIVIILAESALLYGISRSYDGRPTSHAYWWAAARSGFMDVINTNLVSLILLSIIGFAAAAGWQWSMNADISSTLRLAVAAGINLVLVWALLGTYTMRKLALPAVVIGGVTASDGIKVGWRLYRRAGGHLLMTGLETLIVRISVAALIAAGVYAAARSNWQPNDVQLTLATGGGAALLVFVAGFLLLELETRLWLRQYRHWATTFSPAERVRLLTGRVHKA